MTDTEDDETPTEAVFVDLYPREIRVERAWNSRQEQTTPLTDEDRKNREDWPSDRLDESIRKQGVLQAPRVRRDADGGYTLNFGFRRVESCERVRPNQKIRCSVMPTTGSAYKDEERALLENLTENSCRRQLQTWELADRLFSIQQRCGSTYEDLGAHIGLTSKTVERYIRIRRQLCCALWDSWKEDPEKYAFTDLLRVCAQPPDEQVGAYNALIQKRRGGRPQGVKNARPVNTREIGIWREQVEQQIVSAPLAERSFYEGVRAGLDAAESGVMDLKRMLKKAEKRRR